jgi:hypothetical protein
MTWCEPVLHVRGLRNDYGSGDGLVRAANRVAIDVVAARRWR